MRIRWMFQIRKYESYMKKNRKMLAKDVTPEKLLELLNECMQANLTSI